RSLLVADAIGCTLPFDDDRRLRICLGDEDMKVSRSLPADYVVVHPGSSVPSRSLGSPAWQQVVRTFAKEDINIVVTGSNGEDETRAIRRAGGDRVTDLIGRTTLSTLGRVIAGARGICVGNTGAMHLAAAVETPVVAIMPPTVPTNRWRPWLVPHRILGDQQIGCRSCYQRVCPLPRQECLSTVTGESVIAALIAIERSAQYTSSAVGGPS
ncbi:MAG TPA: glycosyltransferase family 9 protein, partial [Ilumatobacteraceae bacterium]